jgi:hypothetical protein
MPSNKRLCVQENNMESQTPMPDGAENDDITVAANYPDEATDTDYEMYDTHYR